MRRSYVPWLILAVLLGLFIGYYVWGPTWVLPQQLSYNVLKDTLTIVLAVIAIAVAVAGFFVYRIVSQRLKDEAERRIMEETRRWIVWLASLTGYKFWEIDKIDQAIKLTEEAYEYAKELDESKPGNQLLLGEIRNNLASYYAQTKKRADLAKGFAEYIHKNSYKFPEQRETWEDTYRKVFEAFPEQK